MKRAETLQCVGCSATLRWRDRRWLVDDNGECGCPACFTEDGSGECWNRHLFDAQGTEAAAAGETRQGLDPKGDSPVGKADAPETTPSPYNRNP